MAPGTKRTSSSQLTPEPLTKRLRADEEKTKTSRDFVDTGVWKEAPVLTGTTKFPKLDDCKNILVTGGAGFIACWLVRHLTLTYPHYNIISFDKLDYCATLNNTSTLSFHPNFTFVHGDITSPACVQSALRTHKIDTIFHFAAQSHVDLSFGNSYEFTSTNVYGTHVLLECARNCGTLKRFVHVSTDEVYGEVAAGVEDCKEGALLQPTNPYAASKAAAEMLVHSYWKSFRLPVIVVRSNNIYGPHQFPEKVIPKFTLLLSRSLPLLLHGDGLHTRRYLHASDATDAFDTILHLGTIGSTYNVGSTDEISNLTLCRLLLSHFGHDIDAPGVLEKWVKHTQDRPFNDRRYAVDASRLGELGWRQKVAFEEGLNGTVEWYRKFGDRWWGDVEKVLGVAFPVVRDGVVVGEEGEAAVRMEKEEKVIGKVVREKGEMDKVALEKEENGHAPKQQEETTRLNGTTTDKDKPKSKQSPKKAKASGNSTSPRIWEKRNNLRSNSTRVHV